MQLEVVIKNNLTQVICDAYFSIVENTHLSMVFKKNWMKHETLDAYNKTIS
jgi:hypothetical protein